MISDRAFDDAHADSVACLMRGALLRSMVDRGDTEALHDTGVAGFGGSPEVLGGLAHLDYPAVTQRVDRIIDKITGEQN